jgi:ribosomal protein L37E
MESKPAGHMICPKCGSERMFWVDHETVECEACRYMTSPNDAMKWEEKPGLITSIKEWFTSWFRW